MKTINDEKTDCNLCVHVQPGTDCKTGEVLLVCSLTVTWAEQRCAKFEYDSMGDDCVN